MPVVQWMTVLGYGVAVVLFCCASAHGQGASDSRLKALGELADFADRICTSVPLKGETANRELSGSAKLELQKLLRNFASAGIEGAGKYQSSSYEGLLQKDLASAMKSNQDCKLAVVMGLKEKLLPSAARPSGATTPSNTAAHGFADRYIDGSAKVLTDRPNIAVYLLPFTGQDISAVSGAAQQALRDAGYNVLPLFKRRFSQDRLDLEAYEGSASLMKKLGAEKYCDSLLLGKMRVTRAPMLASGGLFIAEVGLTVRAISTGTGQILDELTIMEKGGGATAQASIADSVRRLEASITQQLSGWTW